MNSKTSDVVTEKLARQREYAAKWRSKNREKIRAYHRAYRDANREAARKSARASMARARARGKFGTPAARAAQKAWRDSNKEHRAESHRNWRAKNVERLRQRERCRHRDLVEKRRTDRAWREKYPNRYKSAIAAAKAANPDLYRLIARRSAQARRARKANAVVEPVSLKALIARDRLRCHLCGGDIDVKVLTVDHLIPLVRGGAWAEWNLMLAYDRCNKSRGTRALFDPETREAAEAYIRRVSPVLFLEGH